MTIHELPDLMDVMYIWDESSGKVFEGTVFEVNSSLGDGMFFVETKIEIGLDGITVGEVESSTTFACDGLDIGKWVFFSMEGALKAGRGSEIGET